MGGTRSPNAFIIGRRSVVLTSSSEKPIHLLFNLGEFFQVDPFDPFLQFFRVLIL
jgi:hypothetical protein